MIQGSGFCHPQRKTARETPGRNAFYPEADLVGITNTKFRRPGIGFVLQQTIAVRTFLEGDIVLIIDVHEVSKDLEIVIDAVFGARIDLQVIADIAVFTRAATKLVEIFIAIRCRQTQLQTIAFQVLSAAAGSGMVRPFTLPSASVKV